MLKANLDHVRKLVDEACERSGRDASEVTIVAVSKTKPEEAIMELYEAGHRDFGENYIQELRKKHDDLPKDIRWHMIGHLQRNKVKYIAEYIHLIHSVDSYALAETIDKEAAKHNRIIPILIEVNVGGEAQKSGIDPQELPRLAVHVLESCPRLRLQGLMCIPPVYDARAAAQPYFAELRRLRDRLQGESGLALPHLSMGMSGDFEWAVLEGATFVRVGTDIFGPRPAKQS